MTNNFLVVLKFDELEYKSEGESIVEALNKLEVGTMKSIGKLIVIQGKRRAEMTIYPRVVRKLLINKYFKEIFAKRLVLQLK